MKEIHFRCVDALAVLVSAACLALTIEAADGGPYAVCALIPVLAVCSASLTFAAWLARKLEHLENHVYTEGLRAGFQAKQVVKLPEQR